MSKKLGLVVLILAFMLAACDRSQAPLLSPTPTEKGKLPKPQTAIGGMGVVEIAASQTAAALSGVPLGTPAVVISATGGNTATATALGALPGIATPTPTLASGVPSNTPLPSPTTNPLAVATATKTSVAQATVQTVRPATYTLQQGEFPYCLARRFNVDPSDFLTLNGLVDSELLQPGTVLKIPASGSFPGARALKAHPATYVVQASDTIYGIACLYGDVDPLNIAAVNGLAAPYNLSTGAQIKIP